MRAATGAMDLAAGGNPSLAGRITGGGAFVLCAAAVVWLAVAPKLRIAWHGSLTSSAHANRGPLSARLRTGSEALRRAFWAWLLLLGGTVFGLGGTHGVPAWSTTALLLVLGAGFAGWSVLRSAARVAERGEARDEDALRRGTGRTPRRRYLRPSELGWLIGIAFAGGLFALVAVLEPIVNGLFPSGRDYTQAQIHTLVVVLGCILGGYMLTSALSVYLLIRRQRRLIAVEDARIETEDQAFFEIPPTDV